MSRYLTDVSRENRDVSAKNCGFQNMYQQKTVVSKYQKFKCFYMFKKLSYPKYIIKILADQSLTIYVISKLRYSYMWAKKMGKKS